ncbi:MAG: hypothetical protein K1X28_06255 [Parachlamydiales bacterium]|nr:hypothetical protein [Parachlamydiales bacterium]
MPCVKIAKLALLGGPGVGKDTFVQILRKYFPSSSYQQIRLAEPLYEVQSFVYKTCSKEIGENAQDGQLLNFLGKHMRSINPNVLLDRFAQSVREMEQKVDLILCTDLRPIDARFVKEMGFMVVNIVADPSLTVERRKKRGDLSLGGSNHETEKGIDPNMYDLQITNNGTLQDYEKSVMQFLKEFLV